MEYELIDCRPVPAAYAAEVRAIKEDAGNPALTSCLRTQDAVNFARARGCTLSSQAELYACWLRHQPGCNPANPPGYSTHELRSDGVAYAIPRGFPLLPWMFGMDWGNAYNAARICEAARARGWVVTVTYPGSPSEGHHVNFRKEPVIHLFRPLKQGMTGVRVRKFTGRLHFIHPPGVGPGTKTYLARSHWKFDNVVDRAVRDFQDDHHLDPDGIVGHHTLKQLAVATRAEKRRRRNWGLQKALKATVEDLARLRKKRDSARERLADAVGTERKRLQREIDDAAKAIDVNMRQADALRKKIRDLGFEPQS